MLRRLAFHLACAFLLIPLSASAQQTLILKTGEHLIGTLDDIDDDKWYFELAYDDDITIEIDAVDIAGFQSDSIGVKLTDGSVGLGVVRYRDGEFTVNYVDGTVRAVRAEEFDEISDADKIDELTPGFYTPIKRFWSFSADAGYTSKTGNSRSQGLNVGFEVRRRAPKDRVTFKSRIIQEKSRPPDSDSLQTTVEKFDATFSTGIEPIESLLLGVETIQGSDRFQDLDWRSYYTAGVGYKAIDTEVSELLLNVSFGLRNEQFVSGGSSNVAIMNATLSFEYEIGPAEFFWDFAYIPNLGAFLDYQIRSDARVEIDLLNDDLGIRLGLTNDFNNAPQEGVEKHDMFFTSTLIFKIG